MIIFFQAINEKPPLGGFSFITVVDYTVSINRFSTLLKMNMPVTSTMAVKEVLYNNHLILKIPLPKKEYLNASNKDVNGLRKSQNWYLGYLLTG